MDQLLIQLGINIASNAVYDFLKKIFSKSQVVTEEELTSELASFLSIENSTIAAGKIISFLAAKGDIEIRGTKIYAKQSILYSSNKDTKFSLSDNTVSETEKTRIDVGEGAKIEGGGGAKIHQDEDGNIKFYT